MVAWLALAVAVVALIPWLLLGVTVPRFWRKVEPQVRPLLAMFAPPRADMEIHGSGMTFEDVDESPR